ncbi:MAG: EAL domain-containing protein [Candidatus Acidiferrales bacterium]
MDDMGNLLLIAGDLADANVIREAFARTKDQRYTIKSVRTLSEGIERLNKTGIDAVLLDLDLPDSQGIETLDKLLLAVPGVPVLIISDSDDEDLARQAVKRGAQDYLLKGHLDSYSLTQALRSMIARRTLEEALFVEKERAQVTLDSIGDAVLSTDVAGNVTYLNLVAETMTGWGRQEATGRRFSEVFRIIDGETRETSRNPMEQALQENKTVGLTVNCILIRRDGREFAIADSAAPIHDREGKVTGAVIVFRDVSEVRAMALQMSHSAQHDVLTNLPNRVLLSDRLTHAIAIARRRGTQLAVLFLDLDRFKHINDSLGHAVGDKLLQSVAKCLEDCVRASDTVSRQGGDEFVVLLSDVECEEDATLSARRMIAAMTAPHCVAEHDLRMTVSIGISIFPNDGEDAETLIKSADTAMYHAKEGGRNNYQFFKQDMNVRAIERQSIESSLRHAVERNEFVLHYQPKINLASGASTGVEALLRWRHPQRGLLRPAQFVPIAEDCGLILSIGQWVLREACSQARAWIDAGLQPTPVAVNISAIEFRSKDFAEGVRTILEETRLGARYLELELTESVLMQHAESSALALKALKDMGVQLAVDDFGTGYSSLSYLREFPIDILKVDQSFVHEIMADLDNAAIVRAVISMGKSLNQRVIAEGVETREQLAFLRDQRCDEGQGYYFGHPMMPGQFAALLRSGLSENILNQYIA